MANPIDSCDIKVDAKTLWGGSWVNIPYLFANEAYHSASPRFGDGTFLWHFGDSPDTIKQAAASVFAAFSVTTLAEFYVRVSVRPKAEAPAGDWTPIWWGTVVDDQRTLTAATVRVGDQSLTAFELPHILNIRQILSSYAFANGAVQTLGTVAVFNERHHGIGSSVLGNRSSSKHTNPATGRDSYLFEADGQLWSNYDILEYIWAWMMPDDWSDIVFTGLYVSLGQFKEIHDFNGLSVLGAIERLVDRRLGYQFDLVVDPENEQIKLHVQTITDAAITIGGATLPANTEQADYNLPTTFPETHGASDVKFRYTTSSRYDAILVEARASLMVFSESYTAYDRVGNLYENWDTSKETDYRTALGPNVFPVDNDDFRNREIWRGFFTDHRMHPTWNGKTRSAMSGGAGAEQYNVAITFNDDGTVDASTLGPWWNGAVKAEREVILLQGIDYSVNAPHPPEKETPPRWPPGVPFLPIMVFVKDQAAVAPLDRPNQSDKWYLVDRIKTLTEHGLLQNLGVKPLDFCIGFSLTGANPRHYLALGHWDANARTNFYPQLDYKQLVATMMIQLPVTQHILEPTDSPTTLGRIKRIVVKGAEYWRVVPNTVVDVGPNGALKRIHADNLVLRDDKAKLQAVMAWAKPWYSKIRQALEIPVKDLVQPGAPLVGNYINNITGMGGIGSTPVNAIVSEVHWNFETQVRTTKTSSGETDFDYETLAEESSAIDVPQEIVRQAAAVEPIIRLERSFANFQAREPTQSPGGGRALAVIWGKLRYDLDPLGCSWLDLDRGDKGDCYYENYPEYGSDGYPQTLLLPDYPPAESLPEGAPVRSPTVNICAPAGTYVAAAEFPGNKWMVFWTDCPNTECQDFYGYYGGGDEPPPEEGCTGACQYGGVIIEGSIVPPVGRVVCWSYGGASDCDCECFPPTSAPLFHGQLGWGRCATSGSNATLC